jgi:hypothetical protein
MVALEHPPLACRPSPPQGGRLDVTTAFANRDHWKVSETAKLLISPLEGEMSGRTEGGAKERDLSGKVAP